MGSRYKSKVEEAIQGIITSMKGLVLKKSYAAIEVS